MKDRKSLKHLNKGRGDQGATKAAPCILTMISAQ